MNWARTKTILIVMFLLVNCFLCYMYFSTLYKNTMIDDKTIDNIISVLNGNKITVDKKIIPKKYKSMSEISGISAVSQNGSILVQIQKSGWSNINGNYMRGNNETFQITGNQFIYLNTVSADGETTQKEAEKTARNFLEQNGVWKDISLTSVSQENGIFEFTFYQTFQKYKIFDSKMKVTVRGTTIQKWTGSYFNITQDSRRSKYSIAPSVNALMDFIRDDTADKTTNHTIISIEPGYYFGSNVQNETSAIPVYGITTNEKEFYYDARSSEQ